jgi:hypothetical protein
VERGYQKRQGKVKESKEYYATLRQQVEELREKAERYRQELQVLMQEPEEVEYLTGDDLQEYVDYVEGEMLAMASECTMPEQHVIPVEKPDLTKIPELPCRVEMPLWECITQTWEHVALVARHHMAWTILKDQLGISHWFTPTDPTIKRNELGAQITKTEQEMKQKQDIVQGSYGDWVGMLDRCFGFQQYGMEYQICPFRNATQGSTLLGTYSSFDGRVMMFTNGSVRIM